MNHAFTIPNCGRVVNPSFILMNANDEAGIVHVPRRLVHAQATGSPPLANSWVRLSHHR